MKNNRKARKKRNDKDLKDRKVLREGKVKTNKKLMSKGFIGLLLIIILLIITYNLSRHPYLKISQVYVLGNERMEDAEVISKMGSPIGKNILTYKSKDATGRLEDDKQIYKADVKKVFPNIININIEEIYPLFSLKDPKGNLVVSNRASLIKLDDPKAYKLIDLKLKDYNRVSGKPVSDDEEINDFLKEIGKANYLSDIEELNFENKAQIGIIVKDIVVDFGNLDESTYKIVLLESILKDVENKSLNVSRISLEDSKNPVVEIDQGS
ncbi:MAG: FtsQ-type POTRA domain-containing protein [Anaerococcus sp.]|nr:FtsQ-type POTRA domain-containing protein [Anaerococcus sp.]